MSRLLTGSYYRIVKFDYNSLPDDAHCRSSPKEEHFNEKIINILLAAVIVLAFASCGKPQESNGSDSDEKIEISSATPQGESENDESKAPDEENGKILVVYFSWSSFGNTEKMANSVAEHTDGDILRPEPTAAYPTVYNDCTEVAPTERDANARPEIANLPQNLDEYSAIFVGYPIWWHTAQMIIGSFLESYDLSGKKIYPFTQSASMDTEQFENSMEFVRGCAGSATVHEGLFVSAGDMKGIADYLVKDSFIKEYFG